MNQRNLIVIAIVIVGLIVFGAVFFSGHKTSNQTPGATGKTNLTRDDAAKVITDALKKLNNNSVLNPYRVVKTDTPNYIVINGNFRASSVGASATSAFTTKYIPAYEAAGLIKIISRNSDFFGSEFIDYEFTDQGKQYLMTQDQSNFSVILAQLDSIEVTGLTAPNALSSVQSINADYTIKYKLTPFGEIYEKTKTDWQPNEAKPSADSSSSVSFVLYDDGWRVKMQ